MSGTIPSAPVPASSESAPTELAAPSMTLAAEEVAVSKRVQRTLVRASRTTSSRDKQVEADLALEQVVVERVAVGRVVDAVPPVRQEGDVTIIPVVEEELVVVRRLVLKEEVHLRRVRTVTPHVQTVSVRRQDLTVTRTPLDNETLTPGHGVDASTTTEGAIMATMNDETIVAVYDTAAHAEAAVAALKGAGIPADAISLHAGPGHTPATTTRVTGSTSFEPREQGFWASLFGGTSDYDTEVYDRSIEAGSAVVSVKTAEAHVDRVLEILESHDPIDIDDRAASYGLTQTAAEHPIVGATAAGHAASTTGAGPGDREATVQLVEETLAVGKRTVNRGGTRIRRYVVETPVEERVTLHDERVVLDRRPVTDGRPVTADFSDKTIEMTESAEEAVVSKTARVVEEIGLRKEVTDRVETVRDTVRKDEVEIVQVPGTEARPVTNRPIV